MGAYSAVCVCVCVCVCGERETVCLCGPSEGTTATVGEKINVTAPQEPSQGPEFCLPAEHCDGG